MLCVCKCVCVSVAMDLKEVVHHTLCLVVEVNDEFDRAKRFESTVARLSELLTSDLRSGKL